MVQSRMLGKVITDDFLFIHFVMSFILWLFRCRRRYVGRFVSCFFSVPFASRKDITNRTTSTFFSQIDDSEYTDMAIR